MANKQEFTDGKMYKFSTKAYELVAWQISFLAVSSPFLVALLFLERSVSNIILWIVFSMFLGPSLAAMIGCLLKKNHSEYSPFKLYFQKYRQNLGDAVKLEIPILVLASIFLVDIQYQIHTDYFFVAWFFIALLVFLSIVTIYAGIINVKFSFRLRDIFRLSLYYTFTQWKVTLKILSYLVIIGAVMFFLTDFLLILFTGIILKLFIADFPPILSDIENNFTKKQENEVDLDEMENNI
ncbi:DUF624 domain-containing protein [Enterococcus timonensis]|uniref:DUF624 domain-containing protein n=1 Tax=Enterococcus timonensis TaxID=1852364 RepID=UPI0008DAEE27|nr:DUF624 domain-containing protein [Enterococcus timonensis]